MDYAHQLKEAFDAKSRETNLKTSTLGRMCGQGGQFYKRLSDGKRVWPETAKTVLDRLSQIQSKCEAIAASPD